MGERESLNRFLEEALMEYDKLMRQSSRLVQIRKLWSTLDLDERVALQYWLRGQCFTCGRPGLWDGQPYGEGSLCDACCDDQLRSQAASDF